MKEYRKSPFPDQTRSLSGDLDKLSDLYFFVNQN